MKKYILNNPTKAFVVFTFLFSWSFFGLAFLISPQSNSYLHSNINLIGAFGPSIVALLVSYVTSSKLKIKFSILKFILIFLLLVLLYLFSYIFPIFSEIQEKFLAPESILSLGILVALPSMLITLAWNNNNSFGDLFKNFIDLKIKPIYLIFAIFYFPVVGTLSYGLDYLLQIQEVPIDTFNLFNFGSFTPLTVLLVSFAILFFNGPLNEEIGWRGFLTKSILKNHGLLTTALVVGVLWALWHIPLHLNGFYPVDPDLIFTIIFRIFHTTITSLIFTWFFFKTNFSLFGAIILHTSVNLIFINSGVFAVLVNLIVGITLIFLANKQTKKALN